MSDEHNAGGQPVGQLSPDGQWRWDGHNWVPARQQATPPHPPQGQQAGQQQYGAPQYGASPYAGQQYAGQQYGAPQYGAQYGGMPPGAVPQKSGMPTWGKVLLILLSLFVALIVLLTVVGLLVDESYADWSCEDVASEAVRISEDESAVLILTDVTDLEIVEDNREDFTPPESGRGVILSCEGTGTWDDLDETTPVLVELAAGEDGDEWVRYEMTE
jgi:hypothetical protein